MQALRKIASILSSGIILCTLNLMLSCDSYDQDPVVLPGSFNGFVRLSLLDEQGKDWNKGYNDVYKWGGDFLYRDVFQVNLTNSKGKRFASSSSSFGTISTVRDTIPSTNFAFFIAGYLTQEGEETYTMEITSKRYMEADEKVVVKFRMKREGRRTECLRMEVNGKEVAVSRREEFTGWIAESDNISYGLHGGLPITPIIPLQLKDTPKPSQQ